MVAFGMVIIAGILQSPKQELISGWLKLKKIK
jgi:hypothetical protein